MLIIYYSRTGKTKLIAERLQKKLESEAIEIKDMKPRSGILGFINAARDSGSGKLTEIEPSTFDLKNYNPIIICTPVWASRPTPAVLTFIEKADLTKKDVILVLTHYLKEGHRKAVEILSEKIAKKGAMLLTSFNASTLFKSKEKLIRWTEKFSF